MRRFCLRKMWRIPTPHLETKGRNAVQQFIAKHQDEIAGVLSGFDRLVLRGTLRSIALRGGDDPVPVEQSDSAEGVRLTR